MNDVSHWQMVTADPDGLARFYAAVFGWAVSDANAMGYREVRTHDGGAVAGGIWPAPPGSPELTQLFVQVEDIDATLASIDQAGGRVLMPLQQLPDGDAMAMALDPAGRPFGLMTRGG